MTAQPRACAVLSLIEQIRRIPTPVIVRRFNPRPPGVIREGSATDVVLKFLQASPGFRTHAQIMWKTGKSHSAVSWALIFLAEQELIRSIPDVSRNSRYRRYAAVEPKQEA